MDPLLDDALAAAQLWRKDYLLIVNGVIRPDRLELLLGGQSPRVKIVKLHGDLFQRFMAWTVSEMDTFLSEIAPALKAAVAGRDVLVVGHSLRDERIRELAQSTGGALWFTHPQKVPDHLSKNDAMRAVIAPEAAFEKIFPALAQQLKAPPVAARHVRRGVSVNELVLDAVTTPTEHAIDSPNSPRGQTLDDALASVMSVMGPDGVPNSTAFLLSEPRVIVCDAFAVKALLGTRQELDLVGADHKPFTARMLRSNRGHPFGPTLLQVPDTVKIPGLRLTTEPVQLGEPVQIVVAAGKKTGLSTGAVTTAIEATIEIAPIGIVRDLSGLNAVVRSGASGAPVVDSAMRVIGFIVAGSEDEANPTSFMYPSQRWAKFLSNVNPRSLATSRRKPRGR